MAKIIDRSNDPADFVRRIEKLNDELASEKASYMERARRIQEAKKEVLDEAKASGLPKASVKAVVKVRELERRIESAREDLEDDDAASFDNIREALGDFADSPLGAAAVEREEGGTTSAVVDAVKKSMTDEEWEAAGERAGVH